VRIRFVHVIWYKNYTKMIILISAFSNTLSITSHLIHPNYSVIILSDIPAISPREVKWYSHNFGDRIFAIVWDGNSQLNCLESWKGHPAEV